MLFRFLLAWAWTAGAAGPEAEPSVYTGQTPLKRAAMESGRGPEELNGTTGVPGEGGQRVLIGFISGSLVLTGSSIKGGIIGG
jgi:hypothetical protein